MQSRAATVESYLAELPEDRRTAIACIRNRIVQSLPPGYEEIMNWGMITYQVPLELYPDTYNKQPLAMAALASQKNHMALYLMCLYGQPHGEEWLRAEFANAGKKLDMGRSCIRFKKLEDIALDPVVQIIAETDIQQFIRATKSAHQKSTG